jgi:hypothetical protein
MWVSGFEIAGEGGLDTTIVARMLMDSTGRLLWDYYSPEQDFVHRSDRGRSPLRTSTQFRWYAGS